MHPYLASAIATQITQDRTETARQARRARRHRRASATRRAASR